MLKTTFQLTKLAPRLTKTLIKKVNPVVNVAIAFSIGRLYQFSIHKRRIISQGGL